MSAGNFLENQLNTSMKHMFFERSQDVLSLRRWIM